MAIKNPKDNYGEKKVIEMILGMEASEIIAHAAGHGFSQEEIHALLRAMVAVEVEGTLSLISSCETLNSELYLI